jgi:uncharacterized protein YjdB
MFGIAGCGKKATSLHITNAPSSGLLVGGTITLGISGVSSQRNIAWESMNVQIATVNAQGQVLGIAPGTVIIKATDVLSQAEDSITIIVISNTLESITIKNARSVEMNKTLQLTIQATPTGASNAVQWITGNPSIASVSETGLVTGVKLGKTTVTAISKIDSSISTTVEISVTTPTSDGGITVTIFGSESMSVGETQNLQFVLVPASTTGGVKWSTSNPSVVTVNQTTGALLAVSPGVANITATYNTTEEIKPFDVITVTVTPAGGSGISIKIVGPTTMVVGGQSTLVADVSSGGVSWSSSNSMIATVNSNGIVTALQSGTVVITATSTQDTNVKKTHNISISGNTIAPTSISLSGANSLDVYQSLNLTISFTPSNASTSVTWSSSNTSVATVNSSGRVSAVGVGTVVITATSTLNTNVKGQITITVSPSTGSTPESIMINGPDKVGVNQTVTWTITTDPVGANQGVVWGSDTPEVASVNNGVITGHSKGSVRIYCYSILDNNVLNAMIIDVYDVDSNGNLIIDHSN